MGRRGHRYLQHQQHGRLREQHHRVLKFNKDHWYKFRLRVTPDNLSVWMTPKEHLIPLNATVASVVKAYQEDAAKAGQTLTAEQAEAALRRSTRSWIKTSRA